MRIRRSSFAHLIPLEGGAALVLQAVSQVRFTISAEVASVISACEMSVPLDQAIADLRETLQADPATLRACIELLIERGILTASSADEERAHVAASVAGSHGRDPVAMLDAWRRQQLEGAHDYWRVAAPQALGEAAGVRRRLDVILLGDCDVQMETDFLRREALSRRIELRVAASFPSDTALAAERAHDAILIGALAARHAIVLGEPRHHDQGDPARVYVEAVSALVASLRTHSAAPILIDALPEPTVQPLGYADRGAHRHRNRIRRTNLALEAWAEAIADVHIVDLPSVFAFEGASGLLDDGLTGFTHFGAPGWLLQRSPEEAEAVHNLFPEMGPLADSLGGDPYRRERVMARAHMDMLVIALGLESKKCVIVDLDGVLWPGVLAETGRPFAWSPEVSGPHSFVGLYFGIHEALLSLRRRGILLACVSKNDEATVRALWRYEDHYPRGRLLTPASFVTWRVNWDDKAANIASIAEELGFALDAFMFVDDTARERERVRAALPEIAVLGEDLLGLRRALLTDPRLQPLRVTEESARRSELTRAQIDRERLLREAGDASAFLDGLGVVSDVARLAPEDHEARGRVRELFERTTQFNATARRFADAELRAMCEAADGRVFVLRMRDRLADHGLVGAAVLSGGEILNLALSCRVIGMGGEAALLAAVADDPGEGVEAVVGRIVETARNLPVRNVFSLAGFEEDKGSKRFFFEKKKQKTFAS